MLISVKLLVILCIALLLLELGVVVLLVCVFMTSMIHMRTELWTGLRYIASSCDVPWLIMGDFNALSSTEDKIVLQLELRVLAGGYQG